MKLTRPANLVRLALAATITVTTTVDENTDRDAATLHTRARFALHAHADRTARRVRDPLPLFASHRSIGTFIQRRKFHVAQSL